jgi:hypothetical protein
MHQGGMAGAPRFGVARRPPPSPKGVAATFVVACSLLINVSVRDDMSTIIHSS